MAKSKSSGGKAAKGNSNLLLLLALGAGGYFLLKDKSGSTNNGDMTIDPNGYSNGGNGANTPITPNTPTVNYPQTNTSVPTTVPTTLPTLPQTTVPTSTAPANGPFLDRFGTPHRTAAHAEHLNQSGDYAGNLHKAMFDLFGIFSEATETLIMRDVYGGHDGNLDKIGQIYDWLTADTRTNGQVLLNLYGYDIVAGR